MFQVKFHDFSITQILREINFGDSRSAKSAILTHLEDFNVEFYEFSHFFEAEFYQISKIQCPKVAQTATLELRGVPKLISRKICMIDKS